MPGASAITPPQAFYAITLSERPTGDQLGTRNYSPAPSDELQSRRNARRGMRLVVMATHYTAVREAIAAAERVLPGRVALDGAEDPRWQAMIAVADFVETEREVVWSFAQRWGTSPDDDLRSAVATVLLEHLLEHHFDIIIARVERAALSNEFFADTVSRCWKLGQAEEPARGARFDGLVAVIRASRR